MQTEIKELEVNGKLYVPKESIQQMSESVDNMPFVLVRGYGSGVQYGYMKERNGCEVELINSRRIWSWSKATECSQIAVNGVDPKNSKVTVVAPQKYITDAIEIIGITKEAAENLKNQPIWSK